MEDGAVVKTGFGQLLEIRDSLRRSVGPKLHHHFSSVRFDHGDFFLVGGRRILGDQRPQCHHAAQQRQKNRFHFRTIAQLYFFA